VELIIPGQFVPLWIVWQVVVAVIALVSASPQHTWPLGQSDAWRQLNTMLFGGHDCEWEMHLAFKS
jgi:hypothetical protein